jgi:hypothetical protein
MNKQSGSDWPVKLMDAFNRHWQDAHNADYEVCDDPACKAAFAEELRLGLVVENEDGSYGIPAVQP